MNDFLLHKLKKLEQKKIPNPELDLRVLLNHSRYTKKEIVLRSTCDQPLSFTEDEVRFLIKND